jgi:recombinational DNA repair protein (RecF pathway)
LRKDLSQLRQAAYAVALVEQTTEKETPLEPIYHLLESFLTHLNHSAFHELSLPSFEMKLLGELGLAPNLTNASIHAGTRALLEKAVAFDWTQLACLTPSPAQTKEIQRFLRAFMIYHLERVPRQTRGAN